MQFSATPHFVRVLLKCSCVPESVCMYIYFAWFHENLNLNRFIEWVHWKGFALVSVLWLNKGERTKYFKLHACLICISGEFYACGCHRRCRTIATQSFCRHLFTLFSGILAYVAMLAEHMKNHSALEWQSREGKCRISFAHHFYVPGSVWAGSEDTRVSAKVEVKAALH